MTSRNASRLKRLQAGVNALGLPTRETLPVPDHLAGDFESLTVADIQAPFADAPRYCYRPTDAQAAATVEECRRLAQRIRSGEFETLMGVLRQAPSDALKALVWRWRMHLAKARA